MFALGLVALCVAPPGAPVQLSYVYSDSMEPTIGENDGYVLVPASDVGRGDVVTFRSAEHDAYVTHRVVGRTDGGFVTKGDNNANTDQRSGYTPVARDRIVGEVLTLGGDPAVVPHLGAAIQTARANALALAVGALALLGLGAARSRGDARRRDVTRVGDLFGPILLVGFGVVAAGFAYGGVAHDVTLVAVSPSVSAGSANVVAVGSSHPFDLTVRQGAGPLTRRVVDTDGAVVTEQVRNATAVRVRGTVAPPESTGPVTARVTVNRYPAVVPRRLLAALQRIHPLAAGTAGAIPVVAPFWALYRVTADPRAPIRWRPSSAERRLRRRFR